MRQDAQLAKVWEDADFVLWRGREGANGQPVWVVSCAPSASLEASLRLARVFEQRDLLGSTSTLQPLALDEYAGQKRLTLADPGGQFLISCATEALELPQRVAIALGAATALRELHERDVIHCDIQPASLLVDVETGKVWLRATGQCARLPRGRNDESGRSGALPYMSPEQTGRLHRSVDARSDLYSLGITLYELFAGKRPFSADEPLEWMHCHLARQPIPLHHVVSSVPLAISELVHKLLAKTPEDRYQTAAGLEADLRRCHDELVRAGTVASFELGSHDGSPELRVPEKLYGRAREIAQLHDALTSVVTTGRMRIVMISGASGVGKSSLVNELRSAVLARGGLFAAGKVDQLLRDIPYASMAQACRALVRSTLSRSDAEIATFRGALKAALGGHGQLMLNLIPELEHLVGTQPPVAELPPEEARGRFHQLFLRFVAVFASREHPLTLFFDDLQWLDAATLELLRALMFGHSEYLLLICAYRDNELRAPHPFVETLSLLRESDEPLEEFSLHPLAPADLTLLIADALRMPAQRAEALTHVVHEKTAGNPFFITQFLSGLVDDGCLVFSPDGGWTWQLPLIHAQVSTENVLELMVSRFDRLPPRTQRVLQHLACLGRRATTARLATVCRMSAREVDDALWDLARSRLLVPTESGYAFSHDRVQEASYALIPEQELAAMHLNIARALPWHDDGTNEDLFALIHQFDRGSQLLHGEQERARVAQLYLEAGRRGRQALAHASASGYFARGRALLSHDAWQRHYELGVALELGHAEATFLTGDPSTALDLLATLAPRVRNHRDLALVTRLQILAYSAIDQQLKAIEVCRAFLRTIGTDWPLQPTREQVQREYEQIMCQLAGRSVESLIDLPPMTCPDRHATLDTLTAVLPVTIFVSAELNALVICHMVQTSLAHGNAAGSCFAYALFARILGPYFGEPLLGFRFGQLAYDLLDTPGMSAHRARVASVFAVFVHPWTNHVELSIPLVKRACEIAEETGDLTFAAYDRPCMVSLMLAAGRPLASIEAEASAGFDFARNANFGPISEMLRGQLQLTRALRGLTSSPGSFDEPGFDEGAFEQQLENPMSACWWWIRKLQALFLAAEPEAALSAGDKAGALLWVSSSFIDTVDYEFYQALALAALISDRTPELAARLDEHLRRLETWATHGHANFEAQAVLVAAERARTRGQDLDAMRFYERAVARARESGFVHHEAIAHELAARFFRQRSLATSAQAHAAAARACYLRWGALAKVRQLEASFGTEPAAQPIRSHEDFDLATAIRTSRAVSHSVGHAPVVRALMQVAVEHAGAQRGLLLLKSRGELRVEAEARTRERVEVELTPTTGLGEMPGSLLRYVSRTRETVLLDDGMAQHQFSADPYFGGAGARSVLCLPVQKHAHLVGVLYLENNLAPRVFTPARVEVLQLLASQAAISLENALLGEKEALLKEVHHRVKNNLQMISSLLNLQAARVNDPKVAELFTDCRHRVRSMALVHENLYRAGNLSHIPMHEHLCTLVARLSRAYGASARGIELRVAVSDLHLEMGRAITCGLITNELVSNALKHAFPAARTGCVQIDLQARSNDTYELAVSDDGVGLDPEGAFDDTGTLGLQLVRDLALQLDGEVQCHRQAGRTRFAILFARGRAARGQQLEGSPR